MVDPRLYESNDFVLLRSQQPEAFVNRAELLQILQEAITQYPEARSPDIARIEGIEAQAEQLLETSYELVMGPGEFLQWYAVRLEK
ncbi:MAG: chlororespiratory reduction protein 7 [Cyanobacteria bacterium P01_A01_bin.135]